MHYNAMLYTTNGGRNWVTKDIAFPAHVAAFSIPRRDRGYAVGEHGMIYRYSVVPASRQVPGALPAPLMPTFETLLDEKVEALDDFVESLEEFVEKMPDDAGGSAGSAGSAGSSSGGTSGAAGSGGSTSTDVITTDAEALDAVFEESTGSGTSDSGSGVATSDATTSGSGAAGGIPDATSGSGAGGGTPASPFVEKCCGKSVSRWYLAMQAAESILPQFVAQFKNTNLLGAGLRMLVVLPARVNATSAAFSTFKRSQNKGDAKANVASLQAAVDALKEGVSKSLQRPVPST